MVIEHVERLVVGVAADGTLNVRTGPGVRFDGVVERSPLARGLRATGHNRQRGHNGARARLCA